MFLVAFYGFFRVGELTIKTPERRHSVLQFQSLSFLKSRNEVQAAKLVITDYKHNTTGRPFSIIIHRESTVHCCPVDFLLRWCRMNLGTWFDNHMSMNTHIGKVCSKAFRGLYNIRQIRKYLSAESTKCLIHAFVTSHLDYCNALLYKLPQYQYDRIQKVLNAAARVTCLIPKFAHISPVFNLGNLLAASEI